MANHLGRRALLGWGQRVAPVLLAATAGCPRVFGGERGLTLELVVEERTTSVPDEHEPVNFDEWDLTGEEHEILETAIETGSYVEENVNWSGDAPNATEASDGIKDILVGLCSKSPSCEEYSQSSWEAYFVYEGVTYRAKGRYISPGP